MYRDLRDWISFLEKEKDLIRIKEEISLEPDAGAIGRAICDTEGPGVLAENIAGFESPMSIGLHASWRRAAMAAGLPKDLPHKERVKAWKNWFEKPGIKPRVVKDAPCKENILKGDQVNLFKFPIPRINIHDGSFYISKPMAITKDPESDWVNVGMQRMMVLDRNKTGYMFTAPASNTRMIFQKYIKQGKDMPMVVALGTEPVLPIMAGSWIPVGWNELDIAGTVRGEPEEIIQAETCDLPVPARAEIILEGKLKFKERAIEGPFGESHGAYSGYFTTPVFEIEVITHRNNPIYDALFMGRTIAENHYMTTHSKLAGDFVNFMTNHPEITDMAYTPPYPTPLVIQGNWDAANPRAAMLDSPRKVVIAVDEDIDPWNANEVLWAISMRCRADVDIIIIPDMPAGLDPAASPWRTSTRLLIDATKARPPYNRYKPVGFIEPRPETAKWKGKIQEAWKNIQGGNK